MPRFFAFFAFLVFFFWMFFVKLEIETSRAPCREDSLIAIKSDEVFDPGCSGPRAAARLLAIVPRVRGDCGQRDASKDPGLQGTGAALGEATKRAELVLASEFVTGRGQEEGEACPDYCTD
mmetsp:Transcript_11444/g.18643  ORF Transcript_11444/g.18643 Transcript_11444/m.18643 type:complete len:121 (-) Transcript_11444:2046-2408(-)